MKVGIISESPSVTTGFGTTSRHIANALSQAGYQVVCFGISAFGETFNRNDYPYPIWAVGKYQLPDALSEFLKRERPDVALISADISTVNGWHKLCRSLGWNGPTISYFVVDCLPIKSDYLQFMNDTQVRITATNVVACHLGGLGFHDVQVAPHGVDPSVFRPLMQKNELRRKAGLDEKFVIGCFGSNTERKQQTRVMMAISLLKKAGLASNFLLYLHCKPIATPALGGWNLLEIAKDLDIEDLTLFPGKDFEPLAGPSYERNAELPVHSFDDYSYVERMNCCDLIINPAFCGGFEMVVLEAQACGVPIAITNDGSMMVEVAGDGAALLEPVDVGYWKVGGRQFFVAPKTIAQTIVSIVQNEELRKVLIKRGTDNAAKYPWEHLRCSVVKAVEQLEGSLGLSKL